MKTVKKAQHDMIDSRIEADKRIVERRNDVHLDSEARRTYRDFVDSVNRAKDSEIERALMFR